MSLFGKKEKEEIARLNAEMQSLREAMPSESRTLDDINREIKASREELARVQENLESRNRELKDALEELQQAKDQIIETNEKIGNAEFEAIFDGRELPEPGAEQTSLMSGMPSEGR